MTDKSKGFTHMKSKGFSDKPISPFAKKLRTRILRPWELEALLKAIPKKQYKTLFEFLFYGGMRYIEAQEIKNRSDLFDGNSIHITPEIARKVKSKFRDRYVRLNPVGCKVAESYFELDVVLPHWNTWREDLRRWAQQADINPEFLNSKTLRKTWESYLVQTYGEHQLHSIFISQGHDEITALKFYVNLPFNDNDKEQMIKYVTGWI